MPLKLNRTLYNLNVDLNAKADVQSPVLDGSPTAPTAPSGTNTTQIATTEYVQTELNQGKDTVISAFNIDWSLSYSYYKTISSNSTFTFSNSDNGKTITIILNNSSASDITITFPSIIKTTDFETIIKAGKSNIYTFMKSNGSIYSSYISDMA